MLRNSLIGPAEEIAELVADEAADGGAERGTDGSADNSADNGAEGGAEGGAGAISADLDAISADLDEVELTAEELAETAALQARWGARARFNATENNVLTLMYTSQVQAVERGRRARVHTGLLRNESVTGEARVLKARASVQNIISNMQTHPVIWIHHGAPRTRSPSPTPLLYVPLSTPLSIKISRAQVQEAYSQISGNASPRDLADLAGSRCDLAVEPAEAARPFSAPIKR